MASRVEELRVETNAAGEAFRESIRLGLGKVETDRRAMALEKAIAALVDGMESDEARAHDHGCACDDCCDGWAQ